MSPSEWVGGWMGGGWMLPSHPGVQFQLQFALQGPSPLLLSPSSPPPLTLSPTPCSWVAEEWSACSKSCGKLGLQVRAVQCVQRLRDGTNRTLHAKYCSAERPETRRPCSRLPCPAQWRTGAWSQVSDVGMGLRVRLRAAYGGAWLSPTCRVSLPGRSAQPAAGTVCSSGRWSAGVRRAEGAAMGTSQRPSGAATWLSVWVRERVWGQPVVWARCRWLQIFSQIGDDLSKGRMEVGTLELTARLFLGSQPDISQMTLFLRKYLKKSPEVHL